MTALGSSRSGQLDGLAGSVSGACLPPLGRPTSTVPPSETRLAARVSAGMRKTGKEAFVLIHMTDYASNPHVPSDKHGQGFASRCAIEQEGVIGATLA